MERLNWDNFNIKNRDNTKAFEDMCRVLFLRELKKGAYDYGYNVNEAGLEIQPILNDEDGKCMEHNVNISHVEKVAINIHKYTSHYQRQ